MQWVKVSLTATKETAEAAAGWLWDVGAGGVVETSPARSLVTLEAYLPYPRAAAGRARTRLALDALKAEVVQARLPELTTQVVEDRVWKRAWRDSFGPVELPGGLVVVPSWKRGGADPGPGRTALRLDPGVAFGTGLHATTQVTLGLLSRAVFKGCSVADVGTGSGILALASFAWGAGRVLAVDCDPVAADAARANVRRNKATRVVRVVEGDLLRGLAAGGSGDADARGGRRPGQGRGGCFGPFDVVVANITCEPILELIPMLPGVLVRAPASRFIACGLRRDGAKAVREALQRGGFIVRETRRREGWVGLAVGWDLGGGAGK